MKDPYEEERLAKEMAMAAAELRKAMEEGVQRGWFTPRTMQPDSGPTV
jgi:hypothetical protein